MQDGPGEAAARRRDAERLTALEARLAARTAADAPPPGATGVALQGANLAWRMVIELVAGLLIGLGIGMGLDWLFGTRPILLVLFIFLGMAGGVKTMLGTARELGAAAPPAGPVAAPAADDDDDDDDEDGPQGAR